MTPLRLRGGVLEDLHPSLQSAYHLISRYPSSCSNQEYSSVERQLFLILGRANADGTLPNEGREEIVAFPADKDGQTGICKRIIMKDPTGAKKEDKAFTFDSVFPCEDGQEFFYAHTVKPIVDCVIAGYNGCIFAYGQTASGKVCG